MAFVTITDVLEAGSADKPPVFLVDMLQKIPDADSTSAPDHMRRLIYFASLTANVQGKKRKACCFMQLTCTFVQFYKALELKVLRCFLVVDIWHLERTKNSSC